MQHQEQHQQRFEGDSSQLPVAQCVSCLTLREPLLPHWHHRMELFYVARGQGVVKVGLEQRHIAPGDVVVVAPEQVHSLTAAGPEACVCRVVVFDLSMLVGQPGDPMGYTYIRPLQSGGQACTPVICREQPSSAPLRACIDKVMGELHAGTAGWELSVKAGLLDVMALLWRSGSLEQRPAVGRRETQSVRKVLHYIDDHWNEDLSSELLASVAGYSRYHFQRMFRQYVGDSPAIYIRQLRLSRAATLLLQKPWSVSEVCYYSGFHTVSYFIQCFHRQYGVTPRAYRSAGGAGHCAS